MYDYKLCCLSAGTVPVPNTGTDTRYDILEKLMYVYGHKLRYGYVPYTNTGTYSISTLPQMEYPYIIDYKFVKVFYKKRAYKNIFFINENL
jgi:hypothetical protein